MPKSLCSRLHPCTWKHYIKVICKSDTCTWLPPHKFVHHLAPLGPLNKSCYSGRAKSAYTMHSSGDQALGYGQMFNHTRALTWAFFLSVMFAMRWMGFSKQHSIAPFRLYKTARIVIFCFRFHWIFDCVLWALTAFTYFDPCITPKREKKSQFDPWQYRILTKKTKKKIL